MELFKRAQLNCLKAICLLHILQHINGATIGDGTKSLYTGKDIDENDTRGSCAIDGDIYMSETSIPRDHPCHYCICYQSQVTCYWKQCAAAPEGCTVMEFDNVCNPSLYICEIPDKTVQEPVFQLDGSRFKKKLVRRRKISGWNRGPPFPRVRAKRSLYKMPFEEDFPIEFAKVWAAYLNRNLHREKRAIGSSRSQNLIQDTSCSIFGVTYELGDVIGVASDVCMECRCAAGRMFCSPKCCFLPSPFEMDFSGGHSLFVRGDARGSLRSRHPLHYVRNQYTEGQFLR